MITITEYIDYELLYKNNIKNQFTINANGYYFNYKKIINSQKAKKGWITRRKNQIDKVLNKALPAKKVNKL